MNGFASHMAGCTLKTNGDVIYSINGLSYDNKWPKLSLYAL